VGVSLTFKILKNDLTIVLHRSVVRSEADANHMNKRVKFEPDFQGRLNQLDNGPQIISKNRRPKSKARVIDTDVSTRTKSKITCPDQNDGVTARSKMQSISTQGLLLPLHDIIPINDSNMTTKDVSQLGTNDRKMYHDSLIKLKSQVDFDWFHLLDKNGENGDTSLQCLKLLRNSEDRGAIDGHQYNCLVE
jgi:hypothetical protein